MFVHLYMPICVLNANTHKVGKVYELLGLYRLLNGRTTDGARV